MKKIVYPMDCPVCGNKGEFHGSFDVCKGCGWVFDIVQYDYPDEEGCANDMSLNQALEAWKKGEKIR